MADVFTVATERGGGQVVLLFAVADVFIVADVFTVADVFIVATERGGGGQVVCCG